MAKKNDLNFKSIENFTKEDLVNFIDKKRISYLQKIPTKFHFNDFAKLAKKLDSPHLILLLRYLKPYDAANLFIFLNLEKQEKILLTLTPTEINLFFSEMDSNDAVDVIEVMPGAIVKKIYSSISNETRKDILKILHYELDTVGSVMNIDALTFDKDLTINEALTKILQLKDEEELIEIHQIIFILEKNTKTLEGYIRVDQLITGDRNKKLSEIMFNPIYVFTKDDRQEALKKIKEYDIQAIAVLNSENEFVGFVTVGDVLEIVEKEIKEDINLQAGILLNTKPYSKQTSINLFKSRFFWLFILLFTGTITQLITLAFTNLWGVSSSTSMSSSIIITTAITTAISVVPIISGTSGNSATQVTSTLTRELSNDEDYIRLNLKKTFKKELLAGFLMALVLAISNFIRMIIIFILIALLPDTSSHSFLFEGGSWNWNNFGYYCLIAFVTSFAFFIAIQVSAIFGASTPIIALKLKKDPASMSGPLVATSLDIISLTIYFSLTTLLIYLLDPTYLSSAYLINLTYFFS